MYNRKIIIFLKNFFNYKGVLSRAGFLLILIGLFLTIISFLKGIQLLIFIPSFVLSIFFYSLFEYFFVLKNIKYNLDIGKNGNILKIFSKTDKKYNYIVAYKNNNGEMFFMSPNKDLSYDLNEKLNYDLYLYVFGKFDIMRRIIHIGKHNFQKNKEKEQYTYSKKYENTEVLEKIDILRTSFNQVPYIKKEGNTHLYSLNSLKLKIESNNIIELKGYQKLDFLHIILILIGVVGLIIEWQDPFLGGILVFSFLVFLSAKKKKIILNKKTYETYMVIMFIFMIFVSMFYREMSGTGSVYFIQLLLLNLLYPKGSKNSFLFIFLMLFVFVAISLFSSQIRFILLFLTYLFISTYLLFFISGSETFDENNYKIGNILTKFNFLKTFLNIFVFIFVFYFLLPHGEGRNSEGGLQNKNQETVSGFNEEIKLENVSKISKDNNKVFVIENLDNSQFQKLGLKYFRGVRYEFFDGKKWSSQFRDINKIFLNSTATNATKLEFTFFLNGTKNLFIPASVVDIDNKDEYNYYNALRDNTIIKISQTNQDTLKTIFSFELDKNKKIIDKIDEYNDYNFKVDDNVKKVFEKFISKIPEEIKTSPKEITNYIKTKVGLRYSIENPASDLNDFLYGKKMGHCEYFATTLAVVLQHFGHKATLVNGFVGGEYNDFANSIIFRGKDAHSWVEVFDQEKKTWQVFDATPSAYGFLEETYNEYVKPFISFYDYLEIKWYVYIVNYTSSEQKKLLLYLYSNRIIIFKFLIITLFVFIFFRILKKVFGFIFLNQKEKIMFILSKILRQEDFVIYKLGRNSKILFNKYSSFAYKDGVKIGYIEFIKDLVVFFKS